MQGSIFQPVSIAERFLQKEIAGETNFQTESGNLKTFI